MGKKLKKKCCHKYEKKGKQCKKCPMAETCELIAKGDSQKKKKKK